MNAKNLLLVAAGVVGGYILAIVQMRDKYAQMLEEEVEETTKRLEDEYVHRIEAETSTIAAAHEAEIEEAKTRIVEGAKAWIDYQGYVENGVIPDVPFEEDENLAAKAERIELQDYLALTQDPDWATESIDYFKHDNVFAIGIGDGTEKRREGDKIANKWIDILNASVYEAVEEGSLDDCIYVRIEDHKVAVEVAVVDDAYEVRYLGATR